MALATLLGVELNYEDSHWPLCLNDDPLLDAWSSMNIHMHIISRKRDRRKSVQKVCSNDRHRIGVGFQIDTLDES